MYHWYKHISLVTKSPISCKSSWIHSLQRKMQAGVSRISQFIRTNDLHVQYLYIFLARFRAFLWIYWALLTHLQSNIQAGVFSLHIPMIYIYNMSMTFQRDIGLFVTNDIYIYTNDLYKIGLFCEIQDRFVDTQPGVSIVHMY